MQPQPKDEEFAQNLLSQILETVAKTQTDDDDGDDDDGDAVADVWLRRGLLVALDRNGGMMEFTRDEYNAAVAKISGGGMTVIATDGVCQLAMVTQKPVSE